MAYGVNAVIRESLIFLLVSFSPWCFAEDVYIHLKPQVTLDHLDVKLGDVASITTDTDNSRTLKRLVHVPLAKFDSLAVPVSLTREQIEQQLLKLLPELHENISWGGVTAVSIDGKKQAIDLEPYIDQLAAGLIGKITPRLGNVELTLMNNKMESMGAPMGKVRLQPHMQQTQWIGGDIRIPLSIFVDERFYTKPIVHFKVRPVKGTGFSDASGSNVQSSNGDGDLATKTIASHRNPEKSALVKKNQPILIMAQAGAIQIESAGIALSDGFAGDQLRVRRVGENDTLIGRVSGDGAVIVGDN